MISSREAKRCGSYGDRASVYFQTILRRNKQKVVQGKREIYIDH